MKVARYIGDLLFKYECIVIPGFGGFITKEIPAKIHPVQNYFVPPSKDIVFNAHLKANDGLLINHIASSEKITYLEAKKTLDRFVEQCESALKNGKRIHFRKVGTLFLNEAGFKQFAPDGTQNYLADSYGLKSFISPPIKRSTTGRPIVKKQIPQDRKAEHVYERPQIKKPIAKPKAKGPKYIRINVSAVVILLIASAFLIFRFNHVKEYYKNYSSLIPFYYANPNDYLISNYVRLGLANVTNLGDKLKVVGDKLNINYELPKEETDKPIVEEKKTDSIVDTYDILVENLKGKTKDLSEVESENNRAIEAQPNENAAPQPVVLENKIIPKNDQTSPKYYIIGGSFASLANADKFVLELKQKGFEADIAGVNKFNHYRVYYNSYNNIADANQKLAIIRKNENSSAWILPL
ncbi:MAG: SPOR domain-containing protein [Bacteroidetes bacterium]|nr:SPOR domain-containing protein [Bacteroidota bacterium]